MSTGESNSRGSRLSEGVLAFRLLVRQLRAHAIGRELAANHGVAFSRVGLVAASWGMLAGQDQFAGFLGSLWNQPQAWLE